MERQQILVVGGGPVGAVAALACARRGLSVTLLEAQEAIDHSPRASTTQPPTLEILAELGLVDEYMAKGVMSPLIQFWDRTGPSLIAEFQFDRLRGETAFPYAVQTEQHKLSEMAIERLRRMSSADVRMGVRVAELSQSEEKVVLRTEEGDEFEAEYVIACDGGRSTLRKCLDIEFEGYTWPERFLVITTKFDFQAALGCCNRNYMFGAEEWVSLFKVAGDDLLGRWRAVINTREDESDKEALSDQSVRERLRRAFVPADRCDYLHLNLYKVHQRVAARFRQGRVFLCGDAAHVNNPLGGLGLNSGIHEAWDIAGLLDRVLRKESPSILDEYERRRRPLNIEFVQQQTVENKRRLEERDPAQRARYFDELRRTAEDPVAHKAFLMRASLLESARRAAAIR